MTMATRSKSQPTTKQAIIYIRVSDDHQVDGTSLGFQEEECRRYCQKNGFAVIEVFREEGESAKDLSLNNRKEFLRAIEFCRKCKGRVQAFVVLRVNRFARNTEDHFAVRKILHSYGVSLLSVTEPIGNRPAEKLVETVLAATSDYENAIRRQQCSDGMSQKINQGLWPWRPPLGYRSLQCKRRGEKKSRPDPPDDRIFPLLQRALKEYASGVITSPTHFRICLDNWGLPAILGKRISPQLVDQILGTQLKYYAGILSNPFTGEDKPGLHVPMITAEELLQIRTRRSGKIPVVRRDQNNPLFPLRKTVLCGSCFWPLTGSSSRGMGGRYPYYHCYHQGCPMAGKTIPKDTLEREFTSFLNEVSPKREFLLAFEETVLDLWKENAHAHETRAENHERHLAALQEKRIRIFEMREDGSYSKEEFLTRKAKIELEIETVRNAVSQVSSSEFDPERALPIAADLIGRLGREWLKLPPAEIIQFQRLVFPDGLFYVKGQGFRTDKLGLIFELNQARNGQKTRLVDLAGISWNSILEHLHEWEKLRSPASPVLGELVLD